MCVFWASDLHATIKRAICWISPQTLGIFNSITCSDWKGLPWVWHAPSVASRSCTLPSWHAINSTFMWITSSLSLPPSDGTFQTLTSWHAFSCQTYTSYLTR